MLRHGRARESARRRSSPGSCSDLGAGARVLLGTCDDLSIPRPLGPIRDLVGSVSPPLEEALAGGRGAARHPVAADRGARAAAAADGARARGRALGGRRDARLDHRARPADRLAAGVARAHLPRRRGAAGASAARGGRRDPRRRLGDPRARAAVGGRGRLARGRRTRTRCTRRPAATRSTSRELLALRTAADLPPSVANAVLGRASRLDDAARRLVELVSVVPSRVRDLGARRRDAGLGRGGRGAGAPAAARGRPDVRPLPPRAGAARDQVERPDRRAAPAARARSSTRCSPRTPTRPTSSTTPRPPAPRTSSPSTRSSPRGARRRSSRTARRTPTTAAPRTSSTGCRRAEQASCARGAGHGRVRRRPARRRLRARSSARSRIYARAGRRGGGRPLHAGPRRGCTGSRGDGDAPRGEGARGDRDPRAARRVGRAGPRLQRAVAARDAGRRRRAGVRRGASGRSSSRPGSATSSTRAHALVNIGTARLQLDPGETDDAARGARGRRRRGRPGRGDARARQPRLHADVLGAARRGAPLRAAGARLRRASTRCTTSPRTSTTTLALAPPAGGRVGRGRADHAGARSSGASPSPSCSRRRCWPSWPSAAAIPTPPSGWRSSPRRPTARASCSGSSPVLELATECALTTGAPMPAERFEQLVDEVRPRRLAGWGAAAARRRGRPSPGSRSRLDAPSAPPYAAMSERDWRRRGRRLRRGRLDVRPRADAVAARRRARRSPRRSRSPAASAPSR